MSFKRTIWPLLRQTISEFFKDKAMRLAAALAYYTVLSLGPVLIIVIAVTGRIWGDKAIRGEIVDQFGQTMGPETAKLIQTIIQNAGAAGAGIAMWVGLGALLLSATAVFAQLKDALNTAWGVQAATGSALWRTVRDRILAFGVLIAIAFLLLASLIIDALLTALGGWIDRHMGGSAAILQVLNVVVSTGIITVLFAAMFKWLPDVKLAWRDVWFGAAVTAVLFVIGKFALGVYLGHSTAASVYGAAGSLVVVLLWVYYASVIFLLGAEFTQVHAALRGTHVQPAEGARVQRESRKKAVCRDVPGPAHAAPQPAG